MKQLENPKQQNTEQQDTKEGDGKPASPPRKRSSLILILLILVVTGLIAAALYYGWEAFMQYRLLTETRLNEIQIQLDQRPTRTQVDSQLRPLQQSIGTSDGRIGQLEQAQQALLESTEKLYELYGRDENGWKLAEVEYLMSIAQHKLVLENDFAGAAKTLDAASGRIAELADPGLLPVRVRINEEIAALKTRNRPDLVGMTLTLARLGRQISTLQPGFQRKAEPTQAADQPAEATTEEQKPFDQQALEFIKSLVTIKTQKPEQKAVEQTTAIDIAAKLEDNLKLTRWTVLERDDFQYRRLMGENVDLFKQYYDLENAANADFYDSLQQLHKSPIKPELPDIGGSLQLLREIVKKREGEAQQLQQPEVSDDTGGEQ